MKDKYSVFSPPAARSEAFEQGINFKKSPNKFAVYEPLTKTRDQPKFPGNQSVSSNVLDNMRKIPNEYSSLRQTLNFKPSVFEAWMQNDEKQKVQKPSNILRQTMDSKSMFRPKIEKSMSESQNLTGSQVNREYQTKPYTQVDLSNSRKTPTNPETKSLRSIEPYTKEKGIQELKEKWKSGAFKTESKKQKLNQPIDYLKKLSSSRVTKQEDNKYRSYMDRKYSQDLLEQNREDEESKTFRKKLSPNEPVECYTPKMPKSSYDERFKKVGSPASTNSSDCRSPPSSSTKIRTFEEAEKKTEFLKTSLADFEVVKTLGEGKFGLVMMARHKKTKGIYALKKIPKEMIKSHYMVDQLTLEVKLQTYLNHKNILGIYGFFDDATHLFIILEYMEQGTLYSQLKQTKILPESKAAEIIKQITSAVEYLHDQDIAHRDIKPQNIVISHNVNKLCDFGWATLCNERRKTYCGTFDYAAPEILEGKEYDWSVDLWCLGVLTFELLTGKAPFYHLSRKETMRKIVNCEMESVVFPTTMSPEAVDFIEKLIRKNPDQRMKAHQALKHKFLAQVEE